MKLNLGCGNNKLDGYLNIDKFDKEADFLADMVDIDLPSESIEEIVIYQALEHTQWNLLEKILGNCYRLLQSGGRLIIEVPDIDVVCRKILSEGLTQQWHDNIYGGYYRPQDKDRYPDWEFHLGSVHYQAFNFNKLNNALLTSGFKNIRQRPMEEKHPDYRYEENLSVEAIK